jgi:hypothetical protein
VKLCKNGKEQTQKVHRLVAQAFIPNPNNYPQVNHKNGIKTDNRVENLEWCNNRQNIIHSFKIGRVAPFGGKAPRAKLTNPQVIDIKTKLLQGYRNCDLARKYNVTGTTIGDIKSGKSWGKIKIGDTCG